MDLSIAGCLDSNQQSMRFPNARPFVKWVGGKRQLLTVLTELLPKETIYTLL